MKAKKGLLLTSLALSCGLLTGCTGQSADNAAPQVQEVSQDVHNTESAEHKCGGGSCGGEKDHEHKCGGGACGGEK